MSEKKRPFISQQEVEELEWWLNWKRILLVAIIIVGPYVAHRLGWL